jgi:hypothetical protein
VGIAGAHLGTGCRAEGGARGGCWRGRMKAAWSGLTARSSSAPGRSGSASTARSEVEQPPVGRAVTEGDVAASTAFSLLPAPGAPAVGAEGRPRTAQEPSRGPAAHASELRRDGGGARVEGCGGARYERTKVVFRWRKSWCKVSVLFFCCYLVKFIQS